jgi:hypothetical protein
MKSSVLALGALTVCVLAACGGGGGDSDAAASESPAQVQANPALAKYVGTWEICQPFNAGSATYRTRVLSVQGDTATVEMDKVDFSAPGCTGTTIFDVTVKGTAKLAGGTKIATGKTSCETVGNVRRCTTPSAAYEKVVFTYSGLTLRAGSLDVSLPTPNTTALALIALGADGKVTFARGSREADGYPKEQAKFALTKRP